MQFLYLWLLETPQKVIASQLRWSLPTVVNYCGYARQLVADTLPICDDTDFEDIHPDDQIGGRNKQVQIDESAFGKRKYHRGESGCHIRFCGSGQSCLLWSTVDNLILMSASTGHRVHTKWVFGGTEIREVQVGNKTVMKAGRFFAVTVKVQIGRHCCF